ncbi:4Fe-4S binding protein [Ferrovibrio sp.]|uniref:4Fe-4S binding protein n=1 Tax=Ferrovibrio sp. TaxID=1917215 RepID=UPI0035B1DAEF
MRLSSAFVLWERFVFFARLRGRKALRHRHVHLPGQFAAALVLFLLSTMPVMADSRLAEFLPKVQPSELVPGADHFGSAQGTPPVVPAYQGNTLLGYVYLNADFTNAVGYSGKPIHMLAGIDPKGTITGIRLVDHKEPIVLIGIPEAKVVATMNSLIGRNIGAIASGAERPPQVDIVSGATVTVLVMADSVIRSAVRLVRSGRLGGVAQDAIVAAPIQAREIDSERSEIRGWDELVGDGSVRRLSLSIGDVNQAFTRAGNAEAARNAEGRSEDSFIEMFIAPVSVPTIGRSLLGDEGYARLREQLKPSQQAIVVAGDGTYSFKGSGYVRGGIFDRIELLQDGSSTRFRDRNHTRLGALEAVGSPELREIALFVMPDDFRLDLTQPWQLQLLVQRNIGARDKAFITFDLDYSLPEKYLRAVPIASPRAAAPVAATQQVTATDTLEQPLWQRIWWANAFEIGVTVAGLLVLTAIFFFQDTLVRRPRMYAWIRRGFLLFTLIWLGWYTNAQLSVVNVVTFTNALITGFNWEFFLAAPLIFILWAAIAAALLFWGRGPFCGWLCPFGALQELLNNLAQWLKVPQIKVPWALHERLWPIKYIIFLGLFGLSFYSVALAEVFSEVEPFKTSIILKFSRDWPFVIYALTLLSTGLFIERFFCRYLCPLGAALAIPGRIRMFEWLKRWPECGSPCQRCAKECPVQSIHPEGHINVNECIYCMHCQELYHDDHRCPHMIQIRLKRERYDALAAPLTKAGGPKAAYADRNRKPTEPAVPAD